MVDVTIPLTLCMYVGEKPREEGQENDGLRTGSIFGIVIACIVTVLLILIFMITAMVAVYRNHKKQTGKAAFNSTDPATLKRHGSYN